MAVISQSRHSRRIVPISCSQLLRPLGGRMLGHIPMNDASRTHVQHHEDVEQAEAHGDGDEEITGQDLCFART
jgi:hypothetical protein